jgi:hypothetical protein
LRIAAALGLKVSKPPAPLQGASSGSLKWMATALGGAAAVGIAVAFFRPGPIAHSAPAPVPAPAPVIEATPLPASEPEPADTPLSMRSRQHASRRSPPSLRAELALIDRAHSALDGQRPRDALAALDRHDREYRKGALTPESAALRVEALVALGRNGVAVRLGERFLAEHPMSPLSGRVATLIGGAK